MDENDFKKIIHGILEYLDTEIYNADDYSPVRICFDLGILREKIRVAVHGIDKDWCI